MQGVLVRVLQRIKMHLYTEREKEGERERLREVWGTSREAASFIAEGRNRIVERKELFFRKWDSRNGIPPCYPPLDVCESILLSNLGGDVNGFSSQSEWFYRFINSWIPTAGSLMPLLVVYCPLLMETLVPRGVEDTGLGEAGKFSL